MQKIVLLYTIVGNVNREGDFGEQLAIPSRMESARTVQYNDSMARDMPQRNTATCGGGDPGHGFLL